MPTPTVFGLASGGVGDQPSRPVLELAAGGSPANATIPNLDADRNDDPGLTLVRTPGVLFSPDPAGVQVWRFPDTTTSLSGRIRLRLWIAAGGTAGVDVLARAGLFDCDEARTGCSRLSRSTPAWTAPTADFVPIDFDLTLADDHVVSPGRRLEVRVAVPAASATDIWVAFDSAEAPASLSVGP